MKLAFKNDGPAIGHSAFAVAEVADETAPDMVLAAALAAKWAGSLPTALGGMASLLLGAALLLPLVLRGLLAVLAALIPSRHPRAAWLVADSRWLLGPASLALMAMTLALVANNGLNTMIDSFRQATDTWLQQRLAAQLYVNARTDAGALQEWLEIEHPGARVVQRFRHSLQLPSPAGRTVPLEVVSLQPGERFLGFLNAFLRDHILKRARAQPTAAAHFNQLFALQRFHNFLYNGRKR